MTEIAPHKPQYGEPWTVIELDDNYAQLYATGFRVDGRVQTEFAERIVLCVNALSGLSDEEVERLAAIAPEALARSKAIAEHLAEPPLPAPLPTGE
jgi:hypothetical protein